MPLQEQDLINELNVYSGLDSFNSDVLEKELAMCQKLGADVEKIKALKFNALQLSEIRKGLEDNKVDVNKYLNPKMSWTEMEELRLEMSQGIDMSRYRSMGFDTDQLYQIRRGISDGIDVSVYAKKEYLADQMRQLRKGLTKNEEVPIIFFQDPQYDAMQMREIRKGLQAGVDVSTYAMVSMPYMKMRAIRESAEDGLVFDAKTIAKNNADVLKEMHLAFVDKVNIDSYLSMKYDADQLEQIRLGLKENLPLDAYITPEMRGEAIKEIRLGLEQGLDVAQYANAAYNWKQMAEMRIGLEHQIDISPYCKPLYWHDQMREIRLGIEAGLDISKYSSMMYTAKDMRRIKSKLISGEIKSILSEDGLEGGGGVFDRTGGISDQTILVSSMLQNRDDYIMITADKMACFMHLPLRNDGISYTVDAIVAFLTKIKIKKGVDKDAIKKMIAKNEPGEKFLVACGKEHVNGVDGYYEFFFDTEHKNEFKYNKDGSLDFNNADMIQQIKVGDKIAIYHKASKGQNGYNIFGDIMPATNGKEIPILKGDGFMIMNDRVTYVAKVSGAIEMSDGIISIQKIMIVPEVKITDRKINYDGFVYVQGDVKSGSEIVATGDIIIGGHMESSTLTSGGNVIIAGGATCPIRGGITATGNITAKFFEGVTIKGKEISANYFINCNVEARGFIKTFGRQGVIYGGTCHSVAGLESANVGNKTGARTIITLGASQELISEFSRVQKDLSREKENLNALLKEKERLQEIGSGDLRIMQWKIKINAAAGIKEQAIKTLMERKDALDAEIKRAGESQAVITEMIYTNTILIIDGIGYKVVEDRRAYGKLVFKTDGKKENIVVVDA